MRYAACVFDFDFTLIDAFEAIRLCVDYSLGAQGLPGAPDEAVRKTVGMRLSDTFRALTGLEDEERIQAFLACFRGKADEIMTEKTVFLPGAAEALARLKKAGVKTAVVTNKYRYRVDEFLRKSEAEGLIDAVVGFEDVAEPKPAPEGLLAAIKTLGAAKGDTLYVGDSVIDAQTALAAGVDFAGVTTGSASHGELSAYPRVIVAESLGKIISEVVL